MIASASVGCGAMPSATVSTVDSASIATTPDLDQVGHVRADHDEPEQLAVLRLVDRLDPAGRLRPASRRARSRPTGTGRPRPRRRTARAPRPRSARRRRSPDRCRSAAGRRGCRRPRRGRRRSRPRPRPRGTPCARAASSRRSRRPHRCAAPSCADGRRSRSPRGGRTRRPPPRARAPRRAARGRRRRASGRPRPSRPRRNGRSARCRCCSTFVHCLPSWSAIPRLPNAFASSLPRPRPPAGSAGRASRSIVTSLPNVWKIEANSAADDPAAEHDEPARHLGLREQPGRVDAEVASRARDRRPDRERAGRDDRAA